MSRKLPSNNILVQLLIICLITANASSLVSAETKKEVIPINAQLKTYGSGWECKSGYQINDNICVAINMPENAYLTNSSFGDGWKCHWSYSKADNNCIATEIPDNAYLNSSGYGWGCDHGYKTHNNTCVAVRVPENGYYVHSTYGNGWECKRGYMASKDTCIALQVPENAHIGYSGHEWDCNPPYTRHMNKCKLPISN